ncbi:MAG: hypothetical protein CMP57_03810 [Flavobacteriales bacterium]|nr:hypothetical protein [Flavobacteriales bacterium]|tara:strand:- start:521 stop:898 length:378 start_codon:yes stop_codon:yes gene_type:complete
MELIKFNFFTEPPIDFELKKYKVLSYAVESDRRYVDLEFSPWLLNNKLLLLDLNNFVNNLKETRNLLTKKTIRYNEGRIYYESILPENIEDLEIMEQTMRFSIPIIKRSNQFGEELYKNSGNVLW